MTEIQQWLVSNIETAHNFDNDTYNAISDFCVMWAIFECTELNDIGTRAAVDELLSIARRISQRNIAIETPLNFWSNRYISNGVINNKFSKLGFTYEPHSNLVKSVLLRTETNIETQLHALLLITYRLRNNLFHGNKDITIINRQIENLNTASRFLTSTVTASNRHIFLNSA